ncbi:phage major capsid protein [Paraburkholderia sp. 31.1]|uniref:phage major capsid protein n=1 Tax=Paraburkholderia sp. 31.1 TaxID=2615205 RepID=UPI0016555CA8|nr:phage major capsid protein [Paraburkholderia sp. 31.1]MBC8726055.1 phage major capsid protein [Paraburkholderia sp. 31.1]
MVTLTTSDVTLPTQIVDGIVEKSKTGSTIAALSGQEPMRFGDVNIVTFDDDLTAEFVEEGGAKSPDDAKPSSVVAVPHKAVVNFRTSDEFKVADEDYQLGILDKFEEKCSRALARGLDLGAYYRINPRTGNAVTGWTNYLNSTTNRVEKGANADLDIEAAAGLVIGDGYSPTGVALDPTYAWTLSTARYADGRKKYPELGLGIDVSSFEGLRASVSSTVSGKPKDGDAADNKVRAILGNFEQGIRWGVQRTFPFRMLEYGDPDNTGRDLAGHNEILFRAEVIFAWYVFVDQFAVIEDLV